MQLRIATSCGVAARNESKKLRARHLSLGGLPYTRPAVRCPPVKLPPFLLATKRLRSCVLDTQITARIARWCVMRSIARRRRDASIGCRGHWRALPRGARFYDSCVQCAHVSPAVTTIVHEMFPHRTIICVGVCVCGYVGLCV